MAVLFSDDFNRADGAPGNGWSVTTGTWDIASNVLRAHTNGCVVWRGMPEGASADFTVQVTLKSNCAYSGTYPLEFVLRSNSGGTLYYKVWLYPGTLGNAHVRFTRYDNGTTVDLGDYYQFSLVSGEHTFAIQCVGANLTAYLDSAVIGAVSDGTYSYADSFNLTALGVDKWYLDDFAFYDSEASLMIVVPGTVPPGVAGLNLTLFGTGTQWTPGTPGDPEFTVNSGTITGQVITTQTRADLTYTSPNYAGVVTITDPNYGRTATLRVSAESGAGGLGWLLGQGLMEWLNALSQSLAVLLNESADALWDGETIEEGESVLSWVRHIGVPPEGETLASMVVTLLDELQNDHDDPTTIRSIVVDILAELYATNGYPTRTTLPDLASAISQIGTPDLSEVTDAIAAVADQITSLTTTVNIIGGTPTDALSTIISAIGSLSSDLTVVGATAQDAKDAINAVSSNGDDSLADVLSAIGNLGLAIGGSTGVEAALIVCMAALLAGEAGATATELVDMTASVIGAGSNLATIAGIVYDFLTDHPNSQLPSLVTDLATVINDIANVHSDLGTDTTTITDAISGLGTDLGSQLDAISAKIDALTGAGGVWPGLAGVTLGTPVTITETMRVETTMDGIIYHITSPGSSYLSSTIGGETSIKALGLLAFETDNGYLERFQTLSFLDCMVVPTSMLHAAACVLQWRPGATGTVTPWSRTVS